MSTKSSRTVLLIEDDESTREVITCRLGDDGFSVDWADNGEAGLAKALEGDYALIVLDINLPLLSGIEICARIRASNISIPIIMLTSRDSEIDKIVGLEIGADDYIVKPFSLHELMARIRARLRAHGKQLATDPSAEVNELSFGPLVIDLDKRTARLNGRLLQLTVKEYEVVVLLASSPGRPFTRAELLSRVWGVSSEGYEDSVTQLMVRLRKKLEPDSGMLVFIKTVPGIGYRFAELDELTAALSGLPADKSSDPSE